MAIIIDEIVSGDKSGTRQVRRLPIDTVVLIGTSGIEHSHDDTCAGGQVPGILNVDATVFIIARDPGQPSPPLAAVRRRVSELPAVIEIGDADAMIPGRVPSGYQSIEILARVSMSGQPIAQPGDWFGQQVIETSAAEEVQIVIDSQVP